MLRVDDLIGVRFVNHGRSVIEGFDCYGLAIEVSRRLGHELDDLWYQKADTETFAANAESQISKLADKVEVTDERKLGNLIVFFEGESMVHIGVILNEEQFIHAGASGVRVVNLDNYHRKEWRIYKWRQ